MGRRMVYNPPRRIETLVLNAGGHTIHGGIKNLDRGR
jgi:hypothetical protein